MTDSTPQAGDYELTVDWRQADPDHKGVFLRHKAGDVVTLTADEADRLVGAGAAAPKGTKAAKAKDAANDAAARAKTAADNAAAEAKAAASADK